MDATASQLLHQHFLKREGLQDRVRVAQVVLLKQLQELKELKNNNNNKSSLAEWSSMGLYEFTKIMIFKATVTSIVGEYMTLDEHLQDCGIIIFESTSVLGSCGRTSP